MRKQHDYGLTWINSEDLFRVTLKSFEKVFARANQDFDPQESKNAIDPFGAVFLMGATGIDYRTWVDVENSRQVGKTLQNAVGNWHQAVLGLAQGWQDKGASGTIYDIESEGEVTGFGENPQKAVKVIAEVKTEDKTYIYIGEELTKDGFILKHKGFYTSEQLKRIETGISDYDEIKENFIDLDEYSENR